MRYGIHRPASEKKSKYVHEKTPADCMLMLRWGDSRLQQCDAKADKAPLSIMDACTIMHQHPYDEVKVTARAMCMNTIPWQNSRHSMPTPMYRAYDQVHRVTSAPLYVHRVTSAPLVGRTYSRLQVEFSTRLVRLHAPLWLIASQSNTVTPVRPSRSDPTCALNSDTDDMPSVEYHGCTIACIISFTSFLCLIFAKLHSRAEKPLPPGPRRSPLIGNLFNAPRARKPWVAFRHLMQTYGDIVYLEVLGRRMLLLGNPSDILEFLDKRSSITSDRAYSPLISLAGQAYNFGFMPYGQWWRRHRRMFWQQFHPGVVSRYWPIQKSRTHDFLVKLLEQPTSCQKLIRYCFSTTALKVVYNVDIDDVQDTRPSGKYTFVNYPVISQAGGGCTTLWSDPLGIIEEIFVGLREVTISVQFILESFPFVQHLPTWTPGIGKFLKQISRSRITNEHLIAREFNEARARAEINDAEDPSVVTLMLHRLAQTTSSDGDARDEEEVIAKDVAGVAMEASTDTTFSTAEGFFVAMSLHPEVQQKARAELDLIVGPHRLPDFSDRDSLVYINAIVKESLRWHNVLPLGISHNTTEDTELHGYHIPASTAVVPNIWACMHDPRFYPEPERFNPDRFIRDGQLDRGALDPSDFAFGFGRRICPGRHFAEAGLFIAIASVLLLHVFEIVPPLDEDGRPVNT
ncbi:hypothetical protein NUW54_g3309 [Trametes sanguinea]|uniref:Uncharacterized protein n=1 Tax=Trametes sanguinea TaxID=158606 RepID=A0ACC1Q498_9APHY|nr:hypothetical protein NUW54_g3309 [Trametes sanguinea]